MKLSELFERAGVAYPSHMGELDLTGIETDSRRICAGSLFLCIRGMRSDGHQFIAKALANGAVAVVAETVHDACAGGAATILVEDTRRVASLLYHAWYGHPAEGMTLIGVTGTNGKTSVAWMLAEILESAGIPCGLIGTVCCRSSKRVLEVRPTEETANLTTPDPWELYRLLSEMRQDGVRYAVMEVTSHALALRKVEGLSFELGIFTNLSVDHLDFHGTMEDYFAQKQKLFARCKRALVCVDDEYGKRLSADLALPIATCSALAEDGSDFWAADVRTEGLLGCHYRWHLPNQDCSVSLPLAGSFAVINSLLAGTAAYLLGVPTDGILCALEGMNPIPGRMETVQLGAHADVCAVIDYAHTPDALEQLLRSVRQARKGDGRILLLFGCGGDRDRSKRRQMGQIASRLSDFVIITSDNARGEDPVAILDEIEKGLDKEKPYIRIEDRETAIREAVSLCQSGDILVLAGKGHETYEIDATGKHPFDEKEIVRRAWKQRGHRTGRTDEYEDQCRM